jgi:hypothetical protein
VKKRLSEAVEGPYYSYGVLPEGKLPRNYLFITYIYIRVFIYLFITVDQKQLSSTNIAQQIWRLRPTCLIISQTVRILEKMYRAQDVCFIFSVTSITNIFLSKKYLANYSLGKLERLAETRVALPCKVPLFTV